MVAVNDGVHERKSESAPESTSYRVLHVVNHVFQNRADGYSIRGRYIFENQKKSGIEPVIFVLMKGPEQKLRQEVVDGMTFYYAENFSIRLRRMPLVVARMVRQICSIVKKERIEAIHAHSPYHCALPAVIAARLMRIPAIYEVRGLWHETRNSLEPGYEKTMAFRMAKWLDAYCLKNAAGIICISEGLKKHIEKECGVQGIHIVPNGVDSVEFVPARADKKAIGFNDSDVLIGYIGSIRKLEGLDFALKAFQKGRGRFERVKVLILGEGAERAALMRYCHDIGLESSVIFYGNVPHSEVQKYYAAMDVLLFPRVKNLVTDIVTPLKPLEALAMGKLVLASDVGGLKELIPFPELLFKAEDEASFISQLKKLLGDLAGQKSRQQARIDYAKTRDWAVLCRRYLSIYDQYITKRP